MTVVGKILVFVNLVFSLITGALIIMVFVTRTNWKAGFDELNKNYQAALASRDAYASQALTQTTEKEDAERRLNADKAKLVADHKNLEGQLAAKNAENLKNESRAKLAETLLEASAAEKQRRQQEVDNLKAINAATEKKLGELEVAIKEFRDQAVSAQSSFEAAQKRNGLLLEELAKLARENEKLRTTQAVVGVAGVSQGKQPPPEDLKGSVVEVDAKSGLLTVSLGSDSGLKVGHTLEVFHLDPKPEYLGTIRIVDLNFKYAVARPVMPLQAAQLVKGDTVASRVTGR